MSSLRGVTIPYILFVVLGVAFVTSPGDNTRLTVITSGPAEKKGKQNLLRKGTKLDVRLKDKLSAEGLEGRFDGLLDRPVKEEGKVLLAAGTPVTGKFSFDKTGAGERDDRPAIAMRLDAIRIGQQRIKIKTEVFALAVPVAKDGDRLSVFSSPESASTYEKGTLLTFTLAEAVRLPGALR